MTHERDRIAELKCVISDLCEQVRQLRDENASLLLESSACAAVLPGSIYMDPPDGGSVTVAEQLARMAKDAERYRFLRTVNARTYEEDALFVGRDNMDGGDWIGCDLDAAVDEVMQEERH